MEVFFWPWDIDQDTHHADGGSSLFERAWRWAISQLFRMDMFLKPGRRIQGVRSTIASGLGGNFYSAAVSTPR